MPDEKFTYVELRPVKKQEDSPAPWSGRQHGTRQSESLEVVKQETVDDAWFKKGG